ncbi:hypothetical protein ACFLU5_02785 [Bacteroidota bacterium]
MKKLWLLNQTFPIVFIIIFVPNIYAQFIEDSIPYRPRNNIYVNLLGDASIISLNYERLFGVDTNLFFSSKIGIGYNTDYFLRALECGLSYYCPGVGYFLQYATIPHHLTLNLGKGKHFFEFGLGGTIISGNATQNYWFYPIVGYRILALMSNKVNFINFRIYGQIPFSGFDTEDVIFIPFGISVGGSF